MTPDYFGGLSGDPMGGSTRVVTQSGYWTGQAFWVGHQEAGGTFQPYWDKFGAVGRYDYGDLFMVRTLGSDSNQVAVNGRKILLGWISRCNGGLCHDAFASQSLPRDVSLSSEYELLQKFVPELQLLRKSGTYRSVSGSSGSRSALIASSMQLEVVASFTFNISSPPAGPFGIAVLGSPDGRNSTKLLVDCTTGQDGSICRVGIDATNQSSTRTSGSRATGPLQPILPAPWVHLPRPTGMVTVSMHAYVDHGIVEAIFNNRTAMAFSGMTPSVNSTEVRLFGSIPQDYTVQTWELAGIHD